MKKFIIIISFIIFVILITFLSNNMIDDDLDNKVGTRVNNETNNIIEDEVATEYSNLDGKTIAFLGDSLVEGYGNDYKGFDYYMQQSLPSSKFINNSRSGSTVTDNTGTDTIIMLNQVKTLEGNPDIIVFNGGSNDIMGYGLEFLNKDLKKEIGKVELDKTKMTDKSTVMGDFEEVIVELYKKYPDAELYYLDLFLMDDETLEKIAKNKNNIPDIKLRQDEFKEQIKVLCEKLNVKYIEIPDKSIETDKSYRQDDWIHLKEKAYQEISAYILENIK